MNSTLKRQLQFFMEIRGITAAEASRRAKVPKQNLSGWMAGKKPADISQVKRVAEVLGTSLDHLMFGSGKDIESEKIAELDALLGDGWISGLFEVRFRRVKK